MGFEKLVELKQRLVQEQKSNKPNKTQRFSTVAPVVSAIGKLQRLFPKTFPKNPSPKVPLKIGILDDLQAQSEEIGISKENLQLAVRTWCKSPRYWSVTKKGAVRIDLEGNPAGTVEANGAAHARMMASKHFKAKQTAS